MKTKRLTFISGGARSGKSTFAERYATSNASYNNLVYIATSYNSDSEMQVRIAKHQKQRLRSGDPWQTIECPVNLASVAGLIGPNDVVLIDCLTVLLANELALLEASKWQQFASQQTVSKRIISGIKHIHKQAQATIVVSNEVLNAPISGSPLVMAYCKLIGDIHQTIIQQADEAYLIEAGLPLKMKGDVSA